MIVLGQFEFVLNQVGDRHWDQHVAHFKMLSRNLAAVVEADDGRTNAGTLGFKNPEMVYDVDKFADEMLRADRSEVANRPDVGLSMLLGSMAGHKVNLEEGLRHGFFGAAFVNGYCALWSKHDMDSVHRILDVHDFPNLERSEVLPFILSGVK